MTDEQWVELEAKWNEVIDERVERAMVLEIANRIHDARLRQGRTADYELSVALKRAQEAHEALKEATGMLEQAVRVIAGDR